MSGEWTYISECGFVLCVFLIIAAYFLWDKLDNNRMIDLIMGRLLVISGCLMIVPFIIAVFIETLCFLRMEWKYNEPDSIARIVALQDNNLCKYKFGEGRYSMICEECKNCWNYMVCESGCYGSDKLCEHFVTDTVN